MNEIALISISFSLGIIIGYIINSIRNRNISNAVNEITKVQQDALVEKVKSEFKDLSSLALKNSNQEFLSLAETRLANERNITSKELENKKELIDQQLEKMTKELEKVGTQVRDFETDREKKYGELTEGIKNVNKQATDLLSTTNNLKEALSSNKSRGQWGERMAEDVLRLAGFIENINYLHDKKVSDDNTRPDYHFFMPNDLTVNMDVKFPWNNYIKYLECENILEKEDHKKNFFKDVRNRIKEVTSKNYIDPSNKTVDYVLLFIPNESIYSFIHESDRTILDEALEKKVILCSPITLFAVLSIIRKSVDNFALEKTSNELLSLFGLFKKQWDLYKSKTEDLGKKIQSVVKEYEGLTSTRTRMLEKPLQKIDEIRNEKSISLAPESELIDFKEVEA